MNAPRPGCRFAAGFSLVSALFLLLVLAALSAMLARFAGIQHVISAQDQEGALAYQAARAGAEYGAYRVVQGGGACANAPASTLLGNIGFPAAGLAAYRATVTCSAYGPYLDTGGAVTVVKIIATACNQPVSGACPGTAGGLAYAERRVELSLAR